MNIENQKKEEIPLEVEGEKNKERIVEFGKVLEAVRTNGFENPEVKEIVINFLEQQEQEAEKKVEREYADFLLTMMRVDIYAAAGFWDEAYDCIDDVTNIIDSSNEIGERKEEMDRIATEKWQMIQKKRFQSTRIPEGKLEQIYQKGSDKAENNTGEAVDLNG